MKKVLLLAAMLISVFAAQAQNNYNYTPQDTIKDAATTYAYLNTNGTTSGIVGAYEDLGVQLVYTNVSGTSGGTATLQVSNDRITWITAPGASPYTITNTFPQSNVWSVGPIDYKYLRVALAGSGTQRTKVAGKFSIRAKQ